MVLNHREGCAASPPPSPPLPPAAGGAASARATVVGKKKTRKSAAVGGGVCGPTWPTAWPPADHLLSAGGLRGRPVWHARRACGTHPAGKRTGRVPLRAPARTPSPPPPGATRARRRRYAPARRHRGGAAAHARGGDKDKKEKTGCRPALSARRRARGGGVARPRQGGGGTDRNRVREAGAHAWPPRPCSWRQVGEPPPMAACRGGAFGAAPSDHPHENTSGEGRGRLGGAGAWHLVRRQVAANRPPSGPRWGDQSGGAHQPGRAGAHANEGAALLERLQPAQSSGRN